MIDVNDIAQTAADKFKEGLDNYNKNTNTDTEPIEEPNEKDDEDIDTSWLDSFSNRDRDRSEHAANDRADTSIQPETLKEEAVFGGESSSTPEDVYDTSYLDEAFSNFNTWQQQAEEDAKKGRQLAYTNAEVEKQETDALNKALNKSNEAAGIFSDPLGALKNLGDTTAAIPRSIAAGMDGGAEIQNEFKGLNREQQIEKIARNLAENPNYDVEKVLNVLGNNKTLSQTVDAIKDLAKTYEFTNKKRADIAANGETQREGISAASEQQIINDAMKPARDALNKAYTSGDPRAIANAEQQYKQVANRLTEQYANSPAAKSVLNEINSLEMEAPATTTPARPAARPTTPSPATPTPAAPTSETITNDFNEMFANPNTDSLEEYTGITKEELPDNVETAIDEAAANPDDAEHWQILSSLKGKYGDKVDSAINWVQKNLYLHEVPTPVPTNSDKDSTNETNTPTEDNEPTTVEPTTETAGIETVLPQEVVANNPEALDDIQEFITNGDAGGLAQYLINLLGSTALTVIEHAMLSGKENDPTLKDALKEVWERMPASEKSGMDKERISAINNAFKAEPSNLKNVGISSEDTSATNESDYNKGMTEQTNEIVSDRTKKYVLSNPWILAAIRKW